MIKLFSNYRPPTFNLRESRHGAGAAFSGDDASDVAANLLGGGDGIERNWRQSGVVMLGDDQRRVEAGQKRGG